MSDIVREYLSKDAWMDFHTMDLEVDLWSLCPDKQEKITMFNKESDVPRFQQSYGRSYYFSGLMHEADPIPDLLKPILEKVNNMGYGIFNQILLNWYANGHMYIASHADKMDQMVKDSVIVSISIGATRTFRIRDMNKNIIKDYSLKSGDVVVMGGKMQEQFKHEIVKISGKKGLKVGRRINITFRQFKK